MVTFLPAFAAPVIHAAPVDLTPPKNSLGYADEQGFFRNVQRFGSIRFSDGFELPLRFEFWSGRLTGEKSQGSDFGWHGWHCGPLESTAEYYGGEKYLRLTLLCAKVLFLEQSPDDPTRYHTLDGAWTGIVDADKNRITVSRADGWELVFLDRRISRLRTDSGTIVHWKRDDQGRLLAVSEEDEGGNEEKPALRIAWHDDDPESGFIDAIALPGKRYEFRYAGDKTEGRSLTSVAWRDGDAVRAVRFEQQRASLQITSLDGSIRRFQWNGASGRLRSDGLNSYRVLSAEGRPQRIEMTTSTGETLGRQIDSGRGIGRYLNEDGSETVIHRITANGATHNFIDRIDLVEGRRPVTVLKNHYDDSGRLVVRDWMGEPRWLSGFQRGVIEASLAPNQQVDYAIEQYETRQRDADGKAKLTRIDYRFDDQGRHVATEIDGETVYTLSYAADGDYAAYEVAGRFRRTRNLRDDGSVETRLIIPGVSDVAFGYLDSEDPSVSERLIVRELRDPDNRPIERERLDGSTKHLEYHPDSGRLKHELVIARDGETRVSEATFVHQPDGRKMLVIEEDFQTGQLSYREVTLSPRGKPLHARVVSAVAAGEWPAQRQDSQP